MPAGVSAMAWCSPLPTSRPRKAPMPLVSITSTLRSYGPGLTCGTSCGHPHCEEPPCLPEELVVMPLISGLPVPPGAVTPPRSCELQRGSCHAVPEAGHPIAELIKKVMGGRSSVAAPYGPGRRPGLRRLPAAGGPGHRRPGHRPPSGRRPSSLEMWRASAKPSSSPYPFGGRSVWRKIRHADTADAGVACRRRRSRATGRALVRRELAPAAKDECGSVGHQRGLCPDRLILRASCQPRHGCCRLISPQLPLARGC